MKGLIGYFDILGYQNLLKNNSAEESINEVFDIITEMPDRIKELSEKLIKDIQQAKENNESEADEKIKKMDNADEKLMIEFHHNLDHMVFSDTIVFFLPLSNKNQNDQEIAWELMFALFYLSACFSFLVERMHKKGLPVLGVIHEGEFFTRKQCLAGAGIIEAYRLSKSINFSGIVCSEDLSEKVLKLINKSEKLINNDSNIFWLFMYQAPKKDGTEIKLIHINWIYGIQSLNEHEKQLIECRQDIEGYVLKSFWAHQKDCPSSADIVVHNTVKLIRKMIYNYDINKAKKANLTVNNED